ncbi:MAG: hypothetical protein WC007_12735 [Pelobacteraceae bacterium]
MTAVETPAWLKRMDNGAIGEARSKAFLMDRFWILERSVDIDGADFIIQRKITAANLLDPKPPRFGVVQVKFFSDITTTQYIHKEYLLDKSDTPRNEFFLVCHTGFENNADMYVLSATEVIEAFDIAKDGHTHEGKFVIPGRILLQSEKFKVISATHVLDRIERAIEMADFEKNRFFMSWALPSIDADLKRIDPVFLEPIDNWWGHIPTEFVKMKKKAQKALWEIEEIYEKYKKIVESTDPEVALSVAEDIEYDYKAGYGVNLSLPEDLFDEDFVSAVKEHKQKYNTLKSAGILDAFLLLHQRFIEIAAYEIGTKMPLNRDDVYIVEARHDRETLKNFHISTMYEKKENLSLPTSTRLGDSEVQIDGILDSEPGYVRSYVMPGRYCYDYNKGPEGWPEYFNKNPLRFISDTMEEIYKTRFGEE